jgi:HTH-type transcriptional regulator/antitoxin HigA
LFAANVDFVGPQTVSNISRELGGQPVVSKILKGERELNLRQIKALAKRFNVSPEVFIS